MPVKIGNLSVYGADFDQQLAQDSTDGYVTFRERQYRLRS